MTTHGFVIFMNTFFQGPVPTVLDEEDVPVIFATELEAQHEITEFLLIRIKEFVDGNLEFDDAMRDEEYIVEVTVLTDGTFIDKRGNRFGPPAKRGEYG